MRIRTFILAASAAVSVLFFGASYLAISRIFEHTIVENARQSSNALAQITFTSMYQVMSTGWKRKQAEKFLSSIHESTRDTPTTLRIYRTEAVVAEYGRIEQPDMDAVVVAALATGKPETISTPTGMRHILPLVANERCLRCHDMVKEGDVLGAIDVGQDFTPLLDKARHEFLLWAAWMAPLLLGFAAFAVWRVNRRIEQSIETVDRAVSEVNAVSDLKRLDFRGKDLGFSELNQLFGHLGELVDKMRGVAVDKDVLRFEIGLLEKFVITSEVVRDWGEYIARLLADINQVMTTHVMFSVFQIADEDFDLEVFWSAPPSPETLRIMEEHMGKVIRADERFQDIATNVKINHHVPPGNGPQLVLDEEAIGLHTKSLIVTNPKIGGIVGIGVNAEAVEDETLRLVMDSVLSTMLNVVGSVKAIHKFTRDMEYYATRDPLTDLFNRRVFWELFDYEIGRAQRHGYHFALLVIDLDNFKLVNDNFGHAVGDKYLQAFADAIRKTLRPGDIFARYGGDEFAVILPETTLEAGTVVAQRVLEDIYEMNIEAPGGERISGSASIGLGIFPTHAQNSKDLFLFADNMMYKAKGAGKHQIGLPTDEEVATVFRDMTETTMLVINAVNEGRIVPFFQPILDLRANRVAGYEVLSRLALDGVHMEAGRFIEYAEKAGLIHRLDTMVMEKALRALAESGFQGHLFINLSPRALVLADFIESLRRTVAASGLHPGQIVFEITERDTIKNIGVMEGLVNQLKLYGFKLAIDDFGSGFSSFQYLRRFHVDFLKIEGDFILNILENPRDRIFVQTIRQLAADLGIQVIAEHVENEEILDELRKMDIELAQGYHVGRPQGALGENLRWPSL